MSVNRVSFDEWKQDLADLSLTVRDVAAMTPGSSVELAVISRKELDGLNSFIEFREAWVVMTLEKITFTKTGPTSSSIEGKVTTKESSDAEMHFSVEVSEGVWSPIVAAPVDASSTSRLSQWNEWLVPVDSLNSRAQGRAWNIALN